MQTLYAPVQGNARAKKWERKKGRNRQTETQRQAGRGKRNAQRLKTKKQWRS
jgi:hypothetical protein